MSALDDELLRLSGLLPKVEPFEGSRDEQDQAAHFETAGLLFGCDVIVRPAYGKKVPA